MDAHQAAPDSALDVVIVTGGDAVPASVYAAAVDAPDLVIAADSGLDHAIDAGLSPDVLVGDLDSVTPEGLAAFRSRGGQIIAHPTDKDDTDLSLAIDLAIDHGATSITVLGGAGDRLSHVLGNCAAIASAVRRNVATTWHSDGTTVYMASQTLRVAIDGHRGDLVSLLPFGGPASGVSTNGLRWSLSGETLGVAATRGVSNEMTGDSAQVQVSGGLLFVIHERNATP